MNELNDRRLLRAWSRFERHTSQLRTDALHSPRVRPDGLVVDPSEDERQRLDAINEDRQDLIRQLNRLERRRRWARARCPHLVAQIRSTWLSWVERPPSLKSIQSPASA